MKRFTMLAKAIAIIAIAGATLAFTPKKARAYCIDNADPDALCNNFFQGTVVATGGTEFSYAQDEEPTTADDCISVPCTPNIKIRLVTETP